MGRGLHLGLDDYEGKEKKQACYPNLEVFAIGHLFIPWSVNVHWYIDVHRTIQKDLNDPGKHDGVTTHLEPGILECEVKWALGSIAMSKASGGDGIPVELFQIPKDDVVKVLHSIC